MADTISIDPMEIIKTTLFKVILAYVVVLQIVASQQNDKSIFKNIIFRLFTNFIVLLVLEFSLIEATMYSLIITSLMFFVAEK